MNKIIKDKYIRFYECCIPVRGYRRGIVMDMQRDKIEFIPNDLISIINDNIEKEISETISKLDNDDKETFIEYIDFLIENEFAFFLEREELSFFPSLSKEWDSPNIITNILIYLTKMPEFNLSEINEQINSLLCKSVGLVITFDISSSGLSLILDSLSTLSIESVYVSINYNFHMNYDFILSLIKQHPKISLFEIYNIDNNPYENHLTPVITYSNKLNSIQSCGSISPSFFTLNMQLYTESQKHNTCLNRKLSIDDKGDIRNCPAMTKTFGNIKDTSLIEAIKKKEFSRLWTIPKDKIDVCKDCEFRYMCTDCRCFIKDPENIYSQPAKCTYNPYIAKWKDEEGYVPVEECGEYGKKGFAPNHEKIAMLNKI